jgi:hypothetical protein
MTIAPRSHGVPVVLPEPVPNRAQPVPGSILPRWLRMVVRNDQHGYSVVTGSGTTFAVLYARGRPIAAARTRGGPTAEVNSDWLRELLGHAATEWFAVTHRLPLEVAEAAAGLFMPATQAAHRDAATATLHELLVQLRAGAFTGALHVRADEHAFAVALLHHGRVLGCYETDNRSLDPSPDGFTSLLAGAEATLTLCPAGVDDHLERVLARAQADAQAHGRDDSVSDLESALIALLSALEHGLTKALAGDGDQPACLARGLASAYDDVAALAANVDVQPIAPHPDHPLLSPHWDPDAGKIATDRLLETLTLATIPDIWPIAVDALSLAVERAVEPYLAWLALADEASARALEEALVDLLQQARSAARQWRRAFGDAPQASSDLQHAGRNGQSERFGIVQASF